MQIAKVSCESAQSVFYDQLWQSLLQLPRIAPDLFLLPKRLQFWGNCRDFCVTNFIIDQLLIVILCCGVNCLFSNKNAEEAIKTHMTTTAATSVFRSFEYIFCDHAQSSNQELRLCFCYYSKMLATLRGRQKCAINCQL